MPATLLEHASHIIAQITLTAIVSCIVCMLGAYSIQRVVQSHQKLRHVAAKAMGSYTYQYPRPALTVDTVIGESSSRCMQAAHSVLMKIKNLYATMHDVVRLDELPELLDACSLPSNPGSTIQSPLDTAQAPALSGEPSHTAPGGFPGIHTVE